jgi:hypothetical protein
MNSIELTGLRADLPIGVMAALGCLRVCERTEDFRGSKLGWTPAGGTFSAVLYPLSERSAAELVTALMADVKRAAERMELTWRKKLKGLTPQEYREAASAAIVQSRETADWFAAFGCETATDREGIVEPTPLDMTGGPQEFLAGAAELAERLSTTPKARRAKTPEQAYQEALFGPWQYSDDQHSLGWDPMTIKLGAFTNQAPTKMANAGVMAAVWLAFESLPLFPVFSLDGVRGFTRERRAWTFHWPIWKKPLGLDAIGSFLSLAPEEMAKRGAEAVYRSRRFYLNKYYAAFRTPELAPTTAAGD